MFIADIGDSHNGDIETAKGLISACKKAGADVVKFQKRNPERWTGSDKRDDLCDTPWGLMRAIEYQRHLDLGKIGYDIIDETCRSLGIKWTASVWDKESLDFIMTYDVPFISLPGPCLTDIDLVDAIRQTNKAVILSTETKSLGEIADAVSLLGCDNLSILHCSGTCPTLADELNLMAIQTLGRLFPKYVIGYSGHEIGSYPTICAILMGARVIERHVSMRKDKDASDLSIAELEELIGAINTLPQWFGKGYIGPVKQSLAIKKIPRKG